MNMIKHGFSPWDGLKTSFQSKEHPRVNHDLFWYEYIVNGSFPHRLMMMELVADNALCDLWQIVDGWVIFAGRSYD